MKQYKFKVLVTDKLGSDGIEILEEAEDVQVDVQLGLSHEDLVSKIGDYDALIIRSSTHVDKEVIESAAKLKVVGRAGIGVDNIDILAATRNGVMVMNTPQANAVATAELALGLMLSVCRSIPPAHNSLMNGEWRRADFVGWQLYRKTLGIIGFGRIGRLVAVRALGFGMNVLAYDPFVSEEIARELGVTLVDLDELLAAADVITLHTLLTAETKNLINQETIVKMKHGSVLINSARGALVDEKALLAALRSGKIRAAAVDVYSTEPPDNNPLIGMPNVIHTPHLGAATVEAQRDVATQIAHQVLDALRGSDFRNTVNLPFAAGPDYKATQPHMNLAEKLGMIQAALAKSRINRVELEVRGDNVEHLVRPVAAAFLKGLLAASMSEQVNYINAPVRAEEAGILIAQTKRLGSADYPNLISSIIHWEGGHRLISGTLFGNIRPRIVQVDDLLVDANPEGILLVMSNQDVPGVIGRAGTILAENEINIGEWRMGRHRPGSRALSFISLDQEPTANVLSMLRQVDGVIDLAIVNL